MFLGGARERRRPRWPTAAIAAIVVAGWGQLARAEVRPVPTYGASDGGPSVLLSNADGNNPYSGVVRVQARATCSGVFLATTSDDDPRGGDASAWVATNGHCVAFPGTNQVLLDQPGGGSVVFDFFVDTQSRQLRVPIRRVAYATMKGRDLALIELSARVDELRRAGFEPWRPVLTLPADDEPAVIVGAPLQVNPAAAFLRLAACRLEGRAPMLFEFTWHWYGFERTRCADIAPGSSGSPVFSRRTGRIVALINTSNAGQPWYTACQIDSPCEPTPTGSVQPENTSYATPLVGIDRCFSGGDFDVDASGCPLDPGHNVGYSPGQLGAQNPLLASAPLVPPRRTWNVAVTGTPYYRYKVVPVPAGDCRDLRGYGGVQRTVDRPVIDEPLPTKDGHYMLCGIGGQTRQWGSDWQSLDFPTSARVLIDTVPPTLPASIRITDSGPAYLIEFFDLGNEVAVYTYKFGTVGEISCADPAGYRFMFFDFVNVQKIGRPQVFCATPYDGASNPGQVFEALLR
jgi:Trypsin-like peptidase domain